MNVFAPSSSTNETSADALCPSCGAEGLRPFYAVHDVPVHSVVMVSARKDALAFPRADIELAYCPACTFVTNRAFDAGQMHYADGYEATQAFSPTFNAFHERLARELIHRYDLTGKHLLEIGCGRGEFLTLLCQLGGNTGVGYDPASPSGTALLPEGVTVVDEPYAPVPGARYDFVCCKMTLEHIPDVARFVGTVRAGLDEGTTVFFQVPDATRVLQEGAFWDVYHEHCSYFTAGALTHLFRSQGFVVVRTWTAYDGQYLMIEARPSNAPVPALPAPSVEAFRPAVDRFVSTVSTLRASWRERLGRRHRQGQRVVLWGGGSKAVAFLTTLGVYDEVQAAVDVNPHKHGTFLAGTGQPVVGPASLREAPPDHVVVMNPIYRDEIGRMLEALGLSPSIATVEAPHARPLA